MSGGAKDVNLKNISSGEQTGTMFKNLIREEKKNEK